MARRSYDRMYKPVEEPTVEEVVVEEEKIPEVEEPKEELKEEVKVEKEEPKKLITGTVVGGANLNVRKEPNGDVITSIKEGTKVTIVDESNSDWYKIESPEGYVMKKFVNV